MKIELVGGPGCGEVREVKYIDRTLTIDGWAYLRRDRCWSLSGKHGGLYGERRARFYDAVAGVRNGE